MQLCIWLCAIGALLALSPVIAADGSHPRQGPASPALVATDASTPASPVLASAPIAKVADPTRSRSGVLMVLTYGLLLAFALNELVWNWLRASRSHLLCAFAITMVGLLHLSYQEWVLPAIYSKAVAHAGLVQDVLLAATVVAFVAFARRTLESAARHRSLDRLIRVAPLAALGGVGLLYVDPNEIGPWMIRGAAVLCLAGVMLAALREVRKRRNARYLLLATLLCTVGGLVPYLGEAVVPDAIRWIWIDQPLGVCVVGLLLSIASASRIATALSYAAAAVHRMREVEETLHTRLTQQFVEPSRLPEVPRSQAAGPGRSENGEQSGADQGAGIDSTTGLANQRLFAHQLEVMLAISQRDGERLALVVVEVSDITAHATTELGASPDHVMVAMAQRLRLALRGSDLVGRVGPQQFGIALSRIRKDDSFEAVRVRLFDEIVAPIDIGSGRTDSLPQIGWAMFPDDGRTMNELMNHARERMQLALVAEPKAERESVPA